MRYAVQVKSPTRRKKEEKGMDVYRKVRMEAAQGCTDYNAWRVEGGNGRHQVMQKILGKIVGAFVIVVSG